VWRRSLFDWEMVQVRHLLKEINGFSLILGSADSWSWKNGTSLNFSVNSPYGIVRGKRIGE